MTDEELLRGARSRAEMARLAGIDAEDARNGWDAAKNRAVRRSAQDVPALLTALESAEKELRAAQERIRELEIVRTGAAHSSEAWIALSNENATLAAQLEAVRAYATEKQFYLERVHRGYTQTDFSKPLLEVKPLLKLLDTAPSAVLAEHDRAIREAAWDQGYGASQSDNYFGRAFKRERNPYARRSEGADPDSKWSMPRNGNDPAAGSEGAEHAE